MTDQATIEDCLAQCQEQIATVNITMAMLVKERLETERRLRKLERRMSIELMTTAGKMDTHR